MKSLGKKLAATICLIVVMPAWLAYRLQAAMFTPPRAFPGWSQLMSLLPGIVGVYLRRAFYRWVLPRCGQDVWIGFGTVFSHPGAEIGDRVYLGVGCMIGNVTLEEDVLIGSHVSIINGNKQHGIARLDIPIREQPGVFPRVRIGRDCWIGDRAIVMADIDDQSVIGSGSVVTKTLDKRLIAVGNPARVIAERRDDSDTVPEQPVPAEPDFQRTAGSV